MLEPNAVLRKALYTPEEVAAATERKTPTIYSLARRHGLGTRIGAALLFTDDDIAAIKAIDPKGGAPAHKSRTHKEAKPPADPDYRRKRRGRSKSTLKAEPVAGVPADEASDDDAHKTREDGE
jgi:hypothetical protein